MTEGGYFSRPVEQQGRYCQFVEGRLGLAAAGGPQGRLELAVAVEEEEGRPELAAAVEEEEERPELAAAGGLEGL